MKTNAMFLFLLPILASCAALDIDGVRVGAGVNHQTATNTIDLGEFGTIKETGRGEGLQGRIELTNHLKPNLDVGLEIGAGESNLEDVTLDTLDVGGVFRSYLGEGTVRPYAGARLGYRAGFADVPGLGTGDRVDMATAGAFLGLDFRLSEKVSLFFEGGYEGSLAHDFYQHGPAGMVGFSVSF